MEFSNQQPSTHELFERAFRKFFKNKHIKVLQCTSSAAVTVGDNFNSDLFRVLVTFGTEKHEKKASISVIVKAFPKDKELSEQLIRDTHLFEREIEIYQRTLPALHNILGESWTLSAKCIYHSKQPQELIIFEDLAVFGFKMVNRQLGLDLEHCLLTIKKMAQLHASSMVLYKNDPDFICNYQEGIFSNNDLKYDWIKIGYESLMQCCENWNGLEKYFNKLQSLKGTLVDRLAVSLNRNFQGFNVLNHGDPWINNFMFSYTPEGKLKDLKFVDFQVVLFNSSAIDLHYFLCTSPQLEVRAKYFDTILEFYYTELTSILKELNYSLKEVLTKDQFRQDFNSRSFYGFVTSITILPIAKASRRSDATVDDFMAKEQDENGIRSHVYNNERYRKNMEYLIPFYDKMGAFD